jgi:hypothetical protein
MLNNGAPVRLRGLPARGRCALSQTGLASAPRSQVRCVCQRARNRCERSFTGGAERGITSIESAHARKRLRRRFGSRGHGERLSGRPRRRGEYAAVSIPGAHGGLPAEFCSPVCGCAGSMPAGARLRFCCRACTLRSSMRRTACSSTKRARRSSFPRQNKARTTEPCFTRRSIWPNDSAETSTSSFRRTASCESLRRVSASSRRSRRGSVECGIRHCGAMSSSRKA